MKANRIDQALQALADAGRKALVPYVCAGDPAGGDTVALMHSLRDAGADVIELGMPFTDPMADGPTVALAAERALANGMRLRGVLDAVRAFRADDADTPVVLMGYLNPIDAMGIANFAQRAADAGVDAVLVVDLTPEEAPEVAPTLQAAGLHAIFLAAPNTTAQRMAAIGEHAGGYLYYVSLKGVTGSAALDTGDVERRVAELRAHSRLPVLVGFGIRDANTAATIGAVADGVVIGSALIQALVDRGDTPATEVAAGFLGPIRAALDAGAHTTTQQGNAA